LKHQKPSGLSNARIKAGASPDRGGHLFSHTLRLIARQGQRAGYSLRLAACAGKPPIREPTKIRISVEAGRLRPGNRQAGSGDRNDLGQTTPDPGRRATQK
jgi:hypothetical protein